MSIISLLSSIGCVACSRWLQVTKCSHNTPSRSLVGLPRVLENASCEWGSFFPSHWAYRRIQFQVREPAAGHFLVCFWVLWRPSRRRKETLTWGLHGKTKTSGSSVPCEISFLTCKARPCQSIMSEINDPQSSKANVSQTWAGPI